VGDTKDIATRFEELIRSQNMNAKLKRTLVIVAIAVALCGALLALHIANSGQDPSALFKALHGGS
jgi:hypothetical protein